MSDYLVDDAWETILHESKGSSIPVVPFEHYDTLMTDDTRLPRASRVTTGQSTRSSLLQKPAAFVRRVVNFVVSRYGRGRSLLRANLPYGIPDLTRQLVKDNLDSRVANGAFATIHKCHLSRNKKLEMVAVKVLISSDNHDPAMEKKLEKRLDHEMRLWATLKHENILPFYGACTQFGALPGMVSPWLKCGCLNQYMQDHGERELTVTRRLELLCDVICGLVYLHSRNIIHGDLTSMNILIKDDGSACLCDFGLSVLTSDVYGLSYLSSKLGGAAHWAAPEIFSVDPDDDESNGAPQLSFHSDMYLFGSIMFEVVAGKLPWGRMHPLKVMLKLSKKEKPRRPSSAIAPLLTDEVWEYVSVKCWATNPEERPAAEEAEIFVNDLHEKSQRCVYYEPLHEL